MIIDTAMRQELKITKNRTMEMKVIYGSMECSDE
jgi:hypothetical protein